MPPANRLGKGVERVRVAAVVLFGVGLRVFGVRGSVGWGMVLVMPPPGVRGQGRQNAKTEYANEAQE